jgi:dihydropteroate synthase
MGVLNVTPDSFSDGGRYLDPAAAIAHGLRLFADGADVVDVGGESTRPGAEPIDEVEEQRRVLPVVTELARHGRISIDTRHAATARAAAGAGATLINDISASLHEVAAETGAGWVAMHMLGDPRTMQDEPRYDDVVGDVRAFLVERAEAAVVAGVDEVWIDPGFGFGKTTEHNLALLSTMATLVTTGFPVVVGLSRKASLGRLLAASDAAAAAPALPGLSAPGPAPLAVPERIAPAPTDDRIEASLATAVWAVLQGTRMVRAHDVAATVDAIRLVGDLPAGKAA